jgi:hypothetical protein
MSKLKMLILAPLVLFFIMGTSMKSCVSDVPKTGQTTCYDESGIEIDCEGTGQDGDLPKGQSWPEPRFTINGDGTVTDNEDGTVTDNLTDLIWLRDANCIATSYQGFDNDGTPGDGKVTWQHALDFVAWLNDEPDPDCGAGYTDWRLPNVRELLSLIHYGVFDTALTNTDGDGQWSKGMPFTGVQSAFYWTSTTYEPTFAGVGVAAWYVSMLTGVSQAAFKSSSLNYVWPVRGGSFE